MARRSPFDSCQPCGAHSGKNKARALLGSCCSGSAMNPDRIAAGRGTRGQESVGGPRAGSGAAVIAAMCAATVGSSAWPSGEEGTAGVNTTSGGGALGVEQSGQSIPALPISTLPSSVWTFSMMPPEAEHTNWKDCGFTIGDAIATPTEPRNHASTKRRSMVKVRKACMF